MKLNRYLAFLLLFSFIVIEVQSQTVYDNEMKYWYLRDRLRYFIVKTEDPGDIQGSHLVMTSRHWNWPENNFFTDHADYGQECSLLGKYIGVLATEYNLLKINGYDTDAAATDEELMHTLQAYLRLDYCEDLLQPPLTPIVDGFFIRNDIPFNTANGNNPFISQYFNDLHHEPDLLIPDDPLLDANGNLRQVNDVYNNPNAPNVFEKMSQDEAIFLFEGLALAYKLGSSSVSSMAKNIAEYILDRLYGYPVNAGSWRIYDAYGNPIPESNGGYCAFLSPGFVKVAEFFGFFNYTESPLGSAYGLIPSCGSNYNSTNAHMKASLEAIGGGMKQPIYNLTYCMEWDPYYLWLYKVLHDDFSYSQTQPIEVFNELANAPCEGPWRSSPTSGGANGWATTDKWYHTLTEQNCTDLGVIGVFSGMDYMLLHNLYYLMEVDDNTILPYSNKIDPFLEQCCWPLGNGFGSTADPLVFSSFRTITSDEVIFGNEITPNPGDVTYMAKEKITLVPGFKVEDAYFKAIMKPVDYCATNPVRNGFTKDAEINERLSAITEKGGSLETNSYDNDLVSVYPNPSNGIVNVSVQVDSEYLMIVTKNDGTTVLEEKIESTQHQVSLPNKGVYFFKIIFNEKIITEKVIVN